MAQGELSLILPRFFHSFCAHFMRFQIYIGLLFTFLSFHCAGTDRVQTVKPEMVVITDDDSLYCRILRGEILTTKVQIEDGDTLELDNRSITKIVHLASGVDITSRYIDREAIKVETAKRKSLEKRDKLRADVVAGLKKSSELQRVPIALLSATFQGGQPPKVQLTILNLTEKKIDLVKVKVYSFDERGNPQSGSKGRDHVFQATTRIPIEAEEDFTTILTLRNHPKAKKARVEIHYIEYSDNTWWKGEVAAIAD